MTIKFKSNIRPAFTRHGLCSICQECTEGPCVTDTRKLCISRDSDKGAVYIVFTNKMPRVTDKMPCVEDWNGDGPDDHAKAEAKL